MALLDAIADPVRLQIVRRLARGEPATLTELAEALDVHANTVRAHVAALEDAGVVVGNERAVEGRGRPPTEYRLTDDRLLPGADFAGLTELLAAALARSGMGRDELIALGREWGRFLAGRPSKRDPRAAIPAALERLGFDVDVTDDGVEMHGCPCSLLLPDQPELICCLTRGVVEGVLAASGSDQRVARYQNRPQLRTCSASLAKRR